MVKKKKKTHKTKLTFQKIALALSIIIVLNVFFNVGIRAFYPHPDLEDFCTTEHEQLYENPTDCEAVGGEWVTGYNGERGRYIAPPLIEGDKFQPYCDAYATCRDDFDISQTVYNRNVFIVLVVLGLISMILGFSTLAVSAVSTGLQFGGVISFLIGTMRYWADMDEYLRFVIMGIVLIVLIWLGYKKLRD